MNIIHSYKLIHRYILKKKKKININYLINYINNLIEIK